MQHNLPYYNSTQNPAQSIATNNGQVTRFPVCNGPPMLYYSPYNYTNDYSYQYPNDNGNDYFFQYSNANGAYALSQPNYTNICNPVLDEYKINQPLTPINYSYRAEYSANAFNYMTIPPLSLSESDKPNRLPDSTNISSSFDPFRHRQILETLKLSANSNNINWTCRCCFHTDNPIHINLCNVCKSPHFSSATSNKDSQKPSTSFMESPKDDPNKLEICTLSLEDKPTKSKRKHYWKCRKCTLKYPLTVLECETCLNTKENKVNKSCKNKSAKCEVELHKDTVPLRLVNQEDDKNSESCDSPSSDKVKPWKCSVCTFVNQKTSVICDMCNTICSDLYNKPSQETESLSKEELIDLEWNYIVSTCKTERKLYVDEAFPPAPSSLYYLPDKYQEDNSKWIRLRNVEIDNSYRNFSWTVFRELLEPSDVIQGDLGNCWFMSALIALIGREHLIRSLFVTKQLCPQGIYQIRLCKDGIWTSILIDDFAPCDEDGYLLFAYAARKQLWIPLIEKAAAKLFGCYEALETGSVLEALNLLTGAPCHDLLLHHGETDDDLVWTWLVAARKAFFLMVSCCNPPCKNLKEFEGKGLTSKHLYSILDVCQIGEFRLLQLRDPMGNDNWNGDWSNYSDTWTPNLREKLLPNGSQNGTFWMSFEDFSKYFYNVGVCRIRGGWNEMVFSGTFPSFEKQNISCISFVVVEPTEVDFVLYQENQRKIPETERYYMDLSLVLFKKTYDIAPRYKFLGYSQRQLQGFVCYFRTLEPGEYMIVPISFNHWHTENITNLGYQLAIHSSTRILAEMEDTCSMTLRDVILSLIRSCGEIRYLLPGLKIYFLKQGFCGSITLIENHYDYKWIQMKCTEDENCHNVVCSRGELLRTVDCIPPLHGQIIAIYTQLKCDSQFSVVHQLDYKISASPGLDNGENHTNSNHIPEVNADDFLHHPFLLKEYQMLT